MARDDFSEKTKRLLADRVGNFCSNPTCYALTSGPDSNAGVAKIGVAAHIHAASPGGPRYDSDMTSKERKSSVNGIWLCQTCARLIDVGPEGYPAEKLNEWKSNAEEQAKSLLGKPQPVFIKQNLETYSPHLLYEWKSNFSSLYLSLDEKQRTLSNLKCNLSLRNITSNTLTHIRVNFHLFINGHDPEEFYHFYKINSRNHMALGGRYQSYLSPNGVIEIPIEEILEKIKNELKIDDSVLKELILPTIGKLNKVEIKPRNNIKDTFIYSDKEKLLEEYFITKADDVSNSIRGLPIKVTISYTEKHMDFSHVLVGGLFYFAINADSGYYPLHFLTDQFVKPRFSLCNTSGKDDRFVIDLNHEVFNERTSEFHDPDHLCIYSIAQFENTSDFEKTLPISWDQKYVQKHIDLATELLDTKHYHSSIEIFNRIVNINPNDPVSYANRGTAYFYSGRMEDMCKDYQRAHELGNSSYIQWATQNGLCSDLKV